ncbi:MAG TPA: peptidylprolyl isomerase [Verrucomicrobiae bacterium]|jgi:peptidyl-prolyl cis-trans isomerase C
MKTKTKMIFSAALAAALIALPRAQAATSGVAATNAPAAATATNSKPADIMAALFGDPVIAKGKGFEIKQSQLDVVMDAFKAKTAQMGQTVPPEELTKTALNSLIVNQILVQMATDADKAEGKKETELYIAQKVKQFGSQAAVEQQLKAVGKTFDDWRTEMTQQTTATAVMIRELNATPTEAAIQKFYETNSTASELPEQIHVRHILLLTIDPTSPTHAPLSDDQIKAKKKQIDDILKRARSGEDFAELARQYSEDPQTKVNGGDLPSFSHGQMVPEFDAAAFSLTNNQISDVVTTQYGYHIIKLLDKTPARKLALTDKLPSSDLTLADYFKDRLTGQKLQEQAPAYIEKLSKSPGVEILDPALKALMSASTNAPVALPTK